MTYRGFVFLLTLPALIGCPPRRVVSSFDAGARDSGARDARAVDTGAVDSGRPGDTDSGGIDAHMEEVDAFMAQVDAFVPEVDAFVAPGVDAFVPEVDAFVPEVDAFVPEVDAFVPEPDAGDPTFMSFEPCLAAADYVDATAVVFGGGGFSPNCVQVTVGTTVSMPGSASHPLTASTRGTGGNPIPAGATADTDVMFNAPGFFPFYCAVHGTDDGTGMAGVIWVTAP